MRDAGESDISSVMMLSIARHKCEGSWVVYVVCDGMKWVVAPHVLKPACMLRVRPNIHGHDD